MDSYPALGSLGWRVNFGVITRINGQRDLGIYLGHGLATLAGAEYRPRVGSRPTRWRVRRPSGNACALAGSRGVTCYRFDVPFIESEIQMAGCFVTPGLGLVADGAADECDGGRESPQGSGRDVDLSLSRRDGASVAAPGG